MNFVFCPETIAFCFLLELQAFMMFWRGEFKKLHKDDQYSEINVQEILGISEFRFDTFKES